MNGETMPRHVLIAGPTASGKSALALRIAEEQGGVIVNADALQVYDNWRILSARPDAAEQARAPHRLFGHVGRAQPYSTGDWLREVGALLKGPDRLIITGGTGLYFTALTEGLATIPPIPADIRAEGNALREAPDGLERMIAALDTETAGRIDLANPARVQRAWEVLRATGRPLARWQADTPPPLLPLDRTTALVLNAPRDWLTPRIERRFDLMMAGGALDEARNNLDDWDPTLPSSRAIGGPELIAHLRGEISLTQARDLSVIATRQYAKRQRSWFRGRMSDWKMLTPEEVLHFSTASVI